jgi:hypothetical protein
VQGLYGVLSQVLPDYPGIRSASGQPDAVK